MSPCLPIPPSIQRYQTKTSTRLTQNLNLRWDFPRNFLGLEKWKIPDFNKALIYYKIISKRRSNLTSWKILSHSDGREIFKKQEIWRTKLETKFSRQRLTVKLIKIIYITNIIVSQWTQSFILIIWKTLELFSCPICWFSKFWSEISGISYFQVILKTSLYDQSSFISLIFRYHRTNSHGTNSVQGQFWCLQVLPRASTLPNFRAVCPQAVKFQPVRASTANFTCHLTTREVCLDNVDLDKPAIFA